MAAFHSFAFVTLSTTLLFFILCVSNFSLVSALNGGFSVDLIHRDSPKSPFYNPSLTPSERLSNAVRRTYERVKHFNPTASSSSSLQTRDDRLNQAEATVIMNRGEYLMELSVGTPPFPIKAIADTGSDLIWTQCKPCPKCYKQTDPLFDPRKSSTYKTLSCSSRNCGSLNGTCSKDSSSCQYAVSYGDRSYSYGVYAKDTLTLDSTTGRNVKFPKTLIGCGFENDGTFDEKGSGIVGLGGGDESLITQLGSSIDGKFSYCLVPVSSQNQTTSKLNFGSNAVVSGSGVVSTPIAQNQDPKTFYFLTLEAVSVGDTKLPFPKSYFLTGEGNIIIDSGTTLTVFPPDFYSELETEVYKAIDAERVNAPDNVPLNLCYKSSESGGDEINAPTLTMHFRSADVKLETAHTFVRVSEEAVCFAFGPSETVSIYGNLAQMNFLVGYDLKKHTVSFKPTDCTKQS